MSSVSVSEVIGNEGAGIPLTLPDGRAFTARLIDQAMKSAIERTYQGRALQAVMEMKPALTPDEYRDQLAELAKRKAAGAYRFTGLMPLFDTPDGFFVLAQHVFGVDEDAALGMAVASPEELKLVVRQVMEESFRPNRAGAPAAAQP